jgi:hypothetical protein
MLRRTFNQILTALPLVGGASFQNPYDELNEACKLIAKSVCDRNLLIYDDTEQENKPSDRLIKLMICLMKSYGMKANDIAFSKNESWKFSGVDHIYNLSKVVFPDSMVDYCINELGFTLPKGKKHICVVSDSRPQFSHLSGPPENYYINTPKAVLMGCY